MASPIDTWLVEDEPRYRRSFEALLGTTDAFVLTASVEQYEDLPLAIGPPGLVVMDLQLPGVDGIEATRALRRRWPALPVVMLTFRDEAEPVFEALRAGASGYVVKGSRPDDLFRAMAEACDGGTFFSPSVARHVQRHFADPASGAALSEREVEVLQGLADGLSKDAIADRLFLSPHTVDTHKRSLYVKLHARTAAEATAKGVRAGYI